MRSFQSARPDVVITIREMDTAVAMEALRAGEVDVALARLERDRLPIRVLPGPPDLLVVAVSENDPIAAQPRVDLAALAGRPMVMLPRAISPAYFDGLVAACPPLRLRTERHPARSRVHSRNWHWSPPASVSRWCHRAWPALPRPAWYSARSKSRWRRSASPWPGTWSGESEISREMEKDWGSSACPPQTPRHVVARIALGRCGVMRKSASERTTFHTAQPASRFR